MTLDVVVVVVVVVVFCLFFFCCCCCCCCCCCFCCCCACRVTVQTAIKHKETVKFGNVFLDIGAIAFGKKVSTLEKVRNVLQFLLLIL